MAVRRAEVFFCLMCSFSALNAPTWSLLSSTSDLTAVLALLADSGDLAVEMASWMPKLTELLVLRRVKCRRPTWASRCYSVPPSVWIHRTRVCLEPLSSRSCHSACSPIRVVVYYRQTPLRQRYAQADLERFFVQPLIDGRAALFMGLVRSVP